MSKLRYTFTTLAALSLLAAIIAAAAGEQAAPAPRQQLASGAVTGKQVMW
ncbi:hypothetical protein [Streptomyces sp. NPDC050355]|uniref:Uncharacterized protein n=1 Tax=Streptomyces sirii TaxID=3127701 RepID=A0ABZ2QNG5_9ACTN